MRIYLEDVPAEYAFHLHNGKDLKNILELVKELQQMEDEVFKHHVNDMRNDFHNWVRDIVLDLELAHRLSAVKTKEEMQKIVNDRINEIKSYLKTRPALKKRKAPKKHKAKKARKAKHKKKR